MTDENKAVQVIDVSKTALAHYGNREVIRELVDRLMAFHPASKQVGEIGMRGAAQLAVLMGASPLPALNEIHIYYNEGRKQVMVQAGINYWRRRGDQKGGIIWDIQARRMTEDENVNYGIEQGQYGAICRGTKLSDIQELRKLGFSINQIIASKSMTGIGICAKGERAKAGRPVIWTALKRCETDFLKRAFPYIPGEKLPGGAGMQQQEDGTYAPDYGPQWGQLDWEARDDNGGSDLPEETQEEMRGMLFDDQDEVAIVDHETGEIIDGAIEPEPTGDEPPPDTLPEFATWMAERHPYYKSNFHVIGALKKVFGDDIGITFVNRALNDYIKGLEEYAISQTEEAE